MNAYELLRTWPGWSNANAETILASPAWGMSVLYVGNPATLTCRTEPVTDALAIRVAFDDEEHVLALGDSAAFPDLHFLWAQRAALPREVLLALVEKECGGVFQLLEDVTKRLFSVRGLAETCPENLRVFHLEAGGETIDFALGLSPSLTLALGDITHLDLRHPTIRTLTRPAFAEYAVWAPGVVECASLAVGDFLLLPADASAGQWCWERRDDTVVSARGEMRQDLTFAQIAEETLPPVPPADAMVLVCGETPFARAVRAHVGVAPALKVTDLSAPSAVGTADGGETSSLPRADRAFEA